MLFNSYIFLFGFLPVVLLLCFVLAKWLPRAAKFWMIAVSLFFYAWWYPPHLAVILGVLLFTYVIGRGILGSSNPRTRKILLCAGLFVDVGMLGYFKYFNFFIDSLNALVDTPFHVAPILLPLAISFFTFQKVAFLMDVYQGRIRECPFWDYCLFVAFFPQLIAGPIVHYREVVPQFRKPGAFLFRSSDFAVGATIFIMGLFKKVIIADSLAPIANTAFQIAADGKIPSVCDGWLGVLAYALQLYFDFSGYSDMAIGLARMFGILLPLNFHSPYKATSIADFWRRWHITLSNFLRDYLYIPLGGNRCGISRQFFNLAFTMLIGGLWHGAGWTFIIWGVLHGLYLVGNHAWNKSLMGRWASPVISVGGWLVTFFCVLIAWVFFRAGTVSEAGRMLAGMFGAKRIPLKALDAGDFYLILGFMAFVLLLPNTQQILSAFKPALDINDRHSGGYPSWLQWKPNVCWAMVISGMLGICICSMARPSHFLYFQF